MDKFTIKQQMFSLAWLVMIGTAIIAPVEWTEKLLLKQMTKALNNWEPLKGKWKIVWGPCVYKFPFSIFDDNGAIIVQSIAHPHRYALVIRGTNPLSVSDWIFEDFKVTTTVPWQINKQFQHYQHLDPKIAQATGEGLSILQSLKPSAGIPGEGQTILQFLQGAIAQTNESVELFCTGHSLGGTLASTFSLWLADRQGSAEGGEENQWDRDSKVDIICYASGGATAGNEGFAIYSEIRLGEKLHRIWNALDIVPHAWNVQDLQQIPQLYAPQIEASPLVLALVNRAINISSGNNYQQVKPQQQPLPGKVNIERLPYRLFSVQALYQHTQEYINLLGLEPYLSCRTLISN